MKKLKISVSFLCLCVVIILTSLAFFYQKGNTTDGTVGSDSPDKENTLKPSASKGSDEFVNNADASEHSQSSHAEIDYSTYESTTFVIKCSKSPLCLGSLVPQGPNAPSFPQQHTNGVYLGFIFIKSEKSYISWNSSVGRATHS